MAQKPIKYNELEEFPADEVTQGSSVVASLRNVSEAKEIAEGVYSEIFVAEYKMETVILKLIPVGDDKPIDGCYISSFREGVAKLVVLKEIADLCQVKQGYSTEGFVQLKGAMVVKGEPYS
ncbi:unnamed protein product [Wuchereria bancrofti]|uniref:Uncharacterized protein n=1 Tax=Wuchereria bancrofti TaxID=6293 RepID=A0A3P7DX86_WUCBA|nr:unnamed protein product [Wuchereria bancrofti]